MKRTTVVLLAVLLPMVLVLTAAAGGLYWLYWREQRATDRSMEAVKRSVTHDFYDPESAQFRSLDVHSSAMPLRLRVGAVLLGQEPLKYLSEVPTPKDFRGCGEVNAKNKFGAYVGYRRFHVSSGMPPLIDNETYQDATTLCDQIDKALREAAEKDRRPEKTDN
jgi:hypothetical protein